MSTLQYCWRCKMDIPFLDEPEWAQLGPLLADMTKHIQKFRETHSASLKEAVKQGYEQPALDMYFRLTGFRETNVAALWHHRLDQYGPPCRNCGRLLRTKRSAFCAECGATV
jgi:hypothetical protein